MHNVLSDTKFEHNNLDIYKNKEVEVNIQRSTLSSKVYINNNEYESLHQQKKLIDKEVVRLNCNIDEIMDSIKFRIIEEKEIQNRINLI